MSRGVTLRPVTVSRAIRIWHCPQRSSVSASTSAPGARVRRKAAKDRDQRGRRRPKGRMQALTRTFAPGCLRLGAIWCELREDATDFSDQRHSLKTRLTRISHKLSAADFAARWTVISSLLCPGKVENTPVDNCPRQRCPFRPSALLQTSQLETRVGPPASARILA